ncbi:MAG TPA: nuclear transport factor 2 family protein [Gemmatirosa sp.]|nr:nuclear transport factor 2 family protein [Gemmatirosa sp.]
MPNAVSADSADALVERYLASWNEPDPARRAALLAGTFTEDASYVDPLARDAGHAGLARLIAGVHAQFPGFRFARAGRVDAVADHVRFSWTLGPAGATGAAAPIAGTDFARVAADGRLASVHGFLDRVPGDAPSSPDAAAGAAPAGAA